MRHMVGTRLSSPNDRGQLKKKRGKNLISCYLGNNFRTRRHFFFFFIQIKLFILCNKKYFTLKLPSLLVLKKKKNLKNHSNELWYPYFRIFMFELSQLSSHKNVSYKKIVQKYIGTKAVFF